MNPKWWSVVVSVVALIGSLVSIGMTIHSNKKLQAQQQQFEIEFRQKIVLEDAKIVVTRAVASINEIMDAALINATDNISQDVLEEPLRLYAEVRDTYRGIEHHFNEQSRRQINQKLNEVEEAFNTFKGEQINIEILYQYIQNCLAIPQFILQKIEENL